MRPLTTVLLVACLLTAAVGPAAALQSTANAGLDVGADTNEGVGTTHALVQEQQCDFSVTMTDATGTEVTVEEKPERIAALGASAAQTMWEIGGKEQVVALGTFSLYLDGAESRTNVSKSGFGYDVEKVVGTEADLVLAANTTPADTVTKLREAGMTVYQFRRANTIADIEAKTTTMGRLTGNCQGAAEANAWMNANVETAQSVADGQENPRVLVPQGDGYVAAGGTFIDAMVTAAGGENVAADEYDQYPQLSNEIILELDPEVLVLAEWGTAIPTTPPYAATTAGQQNATVVIEASYLNQPAPRSVVYSVRNMSQGFHPEAAASAEWTARGEVSVGNGSATETTTATADPADQTPDDGPAATETPATETDSPGFGVVAALVATLGAALFFRRD